MGEVWLTSRHENVSPVATSRDTKRDNPTLLVTQEFIKSTDKSSIKRHSSTFLQVAVGVVSV